MGIEAAIIGSAVVGAYGASKQASAAKQAAGMQADAARYAADLQQQQYEQSREDLAPFRETGYTALSDISSRMPYFTSQFGQDELAQYLDPSMAFRMKLGNAATERLGNVSGGAVSGNTLRALQDYGQGLASTEYGNAFNRFQTERGNIYNTLANIAGMGQNATNTGINAGQTSATNQGQLAVGAANAQAAGTVGAANAWANAMQGPMNLMSISALRGSNPFGSSGANYSVASGYPAAPSLDYMGGGTGLVVRPQL